MAMPVYKIIFSNEAIPGASNESQDFTYRIDAASADEALGLAELEFKQKHPQKLRNDYRAQVMAAAENTSSRIQHFDLTAPLNPDQ